MNHLVATRFLIGVARPASFMLHARVMIETLFASMAAQTSQNFQWAIVADELIDARTEKLLRETIAPHPNFHLFKVDPLGRGFDVPGLCQQLFGTTRDVIVTRIDDDDALRTDFIERAQAAIGASGASFASYSHVDGLHLASEVGRYALIKSENPSCGMTLLSPDAIKIQVYSAAHTKLHQRVEDKGGVAFRVETGEPYFLSAFHLASVSREQRGRRMLRAVKMKWTETDPADSSYIAMLASFGLPADFDARIARIRKRLVDTRPELFADLAPPGERFTRLDAKNYYRQLALKAKAGLATVLDEDREALEMQYRMMRQAYYLL